MDTHEQLVKKLMRRPGVKAEVERIEREEGALLDALLKGPAGCRPDSGSGGGAHGHATARRGPPGALAGHG
jgi:hypothetical protein